MLEWLEENAELFAWSAGASVFLFVASLVVVGVVIVKLPPDYFAKPKRERRIKKGGIVFRIAKNVLGAALVLAGVAMLILPGQGLLAILIGVMMVDFPGKFRVERWIISRGKILNTANWLRAKFSKPPLVVKQTDEADEDAVPG